MMRIILIKLSILLLLTTVYIGAVNAQNNNSNITSTIYNTPMSGNYIIGSSVSANYASITTAIATLIQNGVSGPTVFNIENGTYSGEYTIPAITGSSYTNTITFQSLNGDTANTRLVNSSNTSARIFSLNNSSYIKFKNLSLITKGSTWSRVFIMFNYSHHITIDSCNLIGNYIISSSNINEKMITCNNCNQITISNSTIKNGTYGIEIYSVSNTPATGYIIENNLITGQFSNGIHTLNTSDTIIIHKNTIIGRIKGIYITNSIKTITITSNNIRINSTLFSAFGIYIDDNTYSPSLKTNEINNNFIEIIGDTSSNSVHFGIYLQNTFHSNVYFNTIKMSSIKNYGSTCFTSSYSLYINLYNNVFESENNYLMQLSNSNSLSSSNYNCFYSTKAFPFKYTGDKTFANYKTASNKDNNSIWSKPIFQTNNSLHINDFNLNGAGTPINGISEDIDGDIRNLTNPDIGADEFFPPVIDVKLNAINTPSDSIFAGIYPIKLSITNLGTNTITEDSLHYCVDNGPITSIKWTGNLTSASIDSMILVGTENFTIGSHTIKAWSSHPNNTQDLNNSNDTFVRIVNALGMPILTVNPTSISGTTTICDDSLIIPLTINNTGNSTLYYNIDSNNSSSEPLNVLILTYGAPYYNSLEPYMGETFTHYQTTTSNTNNIDTLQAAIAGKDVVIIPFIESGSSTSAYTTFATTLQNFANDGGVVMFAGQGYENAITNTGLWPSFTNNGTYNSTNVNLTNHIITDNISLADLSNFTDYFYYTNASTANFTTLISYSNAYKIAGYFPFGMGNVFYLGYAYRYPNKIVESKLLSNSLKWAYNKRNNWLSSSISFDTLNPGDSTIINVKLNSLGLDPGTYTSNLTITSNDYANQSIVVPCTITVVGTPIITSNNPLVNFNSQYNNIATLDSVKVFNSGCGNLIISGITTNNSVYSIESYDTILAPYDSTYIVYRLFSTTAGSYSAISTITSNIANYTINLTGSTVNPPDIFATPTPLYINITNCNDSATTNLQIHNTGGDTLIANFSLEANATNNSFISISNFTSTLTQGASDSIMVTFNSTGLYTGTHIDSIKVSTNSPINPVIYIPCTLTVQNLMPWGANLNNDTVICPNTLLNLSASGGRSYLWSNGDTNSTTIVSPTESSIYFVTVSDEYCFIKDSVVIFINDPKPYIGADTNICSSQSITLGAGAYNVTYDWSNGSTSQTVTIDSTGIGFGSINIDVEVENLLGCIGRDTIMITFVDCTGLNNVDNENFIMSIYPNPTNGKFTISSTDTNLDKLKLEVLDVNGRIVYENQLLNTRGIISEQVDLSHRAKGIYIVRLSNGSLVKTFKVVVQ